MITIAHRMPRDATAMREWASVAVDRVELDVQLVGGRVVVSHFLPLLRIRGWLQHDGGRFRWRGRPPHDPTLDEALALVPASVSALLDPKETGRARRSALIEALAVALPERDRFVVSTEHVDDLEHYRSLGFGAWRTVHDDAALRDVLAGRACDGVSIRHTLLDGPTVARLHDVVPTVVAWTVNDPARAAELSAAGVDGITTDRPEIVSILRSGQHRGLPPTS